MYDAIIVGARCAGSPLAMLLARQGHRVLLVDKASFPSDIMSTHGAKTPAVEKLKEWAFPHFRCRPRDTLRFTRLAAS